MGKPWPLVVRRLSEKLGFGQKRCHNCHEPFFPPHFGAPVDGLCHVCENQFAPYVGARCKVCGLPVGAQGKQLCQACKKGPRPWAGYAYYGLYAGPLRNLLLRFKFNSELNLSALFAMFLLNCCSCLPQPDYLVPIPQMPAQLAKRGHNQAYEIARAFARASGLVLKGSLLERIRPGLPQEGLSAEERRKNLEMAFVAAPGAKGKVIWLVDDIMTTGSTLESAARVLRSAGAARVYLLFVARTPLF